jgi:hypothetical protein
MNDKNFVATQLTGRCIEFREVGEDRYACTGTLSPDGRTLILYYYGDERPWEIKLKRPTATTRVWRGQGMENGELQVTLRTTLRSLSFNRRKSMVLEGEWRHLNPAGKRDLDIPGEWRWELWPEGVEDPFVKPVRKRVAKKSRTRRSGARTARSKNPPKDKRKR